MADRICPFLWFDGRAEEAARFYTSLFKNSKLGKVLPGPDGKLMGINFTLEGREFMALNGGPHYKFSPAISFFVKCKTQEEVDTLWDKLSAGRVMQAMLQMEKIDIKGLKRAAAAK